MQSCETEHVNVLDDKLTIQKNAFYQPLQCTIALSSEKQCFNLLISFRISRDQLWKLAHM